jgi:hypothetical protein
MRISLLKETVFVFAMVMMASCSAADISIGVFLDGADTNGIQKFNTDTKKQHAIIQYALLWDTSNGSTHRTLMNWVRDAGATPMCVWGRGLGTTSGNLDYAQVVAGQADGIIQDVAQAVAEFGDPVIFTLDMEFNHEGSASCYLNDSSQNASGFGEMWRHVHHVFEAAGATNVQWAWVASYQSAPNNEKNDYNNYWPGDEYVDWVGALGFDCNWNSSNPGPGNLSFHKIFGPILSDFAGRYPTKPQIIGWFGTVGDASQKASWITSSYAAMNSYNNLRAVCWYNAESDVFDFRIWSANAGAVPQSVTDSYATAIKPSSFLSSLPDYDDIVPVDGGGGTSGTIIDLTPNKQVFSSTDTISVIANVQAGSAPFYPYVRILMSDGRTLYYVRNGGFTAARRPYLSGGPFSLASPIYGYQVLNESFSGVATGQYTLEGEAAGSNMIPIGTTDREALTVQ